MLSDKSALRATYLDRRRGRDSEKRKQMDLEICQTLGASPLLRGADALLIYYPVRGEIDLLPLLEVANSLGIPVGFPICGAENSLSFHRVRSLKEMVPGAYKILAPVPRAESILSTRKTLLVVPALCYDRDGYRLGYGGGYYDRFLADFPGISCGVAYLEDIREALPRDPYDLPVAYIATQSKLFCTKEPL